jgi:hypothetical protein
VASHPAPPAVAGRDPVTADNSYRARTGPTAPPHRDRGQRAVHITDSEIPQPDGART